MDPSASSLRSIPELLKTQELFYIRTDPDLRIQEIDDRIHEITAFDKTHYPGRGLSALFLPPDPPASLESILRKSPPDPDIQLKLKIAPDATMEVIGNLIRHQQSCLTRLYCSLFIYPRPDGYEMLFKIHPYFVDNAYYRIFPREMILVLSGEDRVVDYNEHFFLRFQRIYDGKSLMGSPIQRFIAKEDWERLTQGRSLRIKAIQGLITREVEGWQLEYGGKALDFAHGWLFDKAAKFQKSERTIHAQTHEPYSYFILDKPLPLSQNEFRMDFQAERKAGENVWCIMFGHNRVEDFAPDSRGYLLGIHGNSILLKRKNQTVIEQPVDPEKITGLLQCRAVFRNGGIQLFINGQKVFEYIDPFPVLPGEGSRYCGLAFGYRACFSEFALYSHASPEKSIQPAEDETLVRLQPFPEQIYNADISRGIFHGRTSWFLNLSEVTNKTLLDQLKEKADKAQQEALRLHEENIRLREMSYGLQAIVGETPVMHKIKSMVQQIADSPASVLVLGATGTGKDLVAFHIHKLSRRSGPFIKIDCAAIPATLLEAELFGYEKGAFTGAVRRHTGRIEQAQGGTLYLDEVGNLSLNAQAKLLHVINDREFNRIGGERSIKVDVRIIAATNADLNTMGKKGAFRRDLFFRLNVISIPLPSLDGRREDIPLLIQYFLTNKSGKRQWKVEKSLLEALEKRAWPGNVRELFNILEHAMAVANSDTLTLRDLPEEFLKEAFSTTSRKPRKPVDDFTLAWRISGGNLKLCAAFLGKAKSEIAEEAQKRGQRDPAQMRIEVRFPELNERQLKILGHVYRNRIMTLFELCGVFPVARLTLQRDLNRLMKSGFIQRRGRTRAVKFIWANQAV